MDPFLGESLIAERALDVTYRGGATQTGAKIYFEGEAFGQQLYKSMLHILNGLNPTIVENLITLDKGQIKKGEVLNNGSELIHYFELNKYGYYDVE